MKSQSFKAASSANLLPWLAQAKARRVGGSPNARALCLSLPLPQGEGEAVAFRGPSTQQQPLGQWPALEGSPGGPRRLLLTACSSSAPDEIELVRQEAPAGEFSGPDAHVAVLEESPDPVSPHEIGELVLSVPGSEMGLRVGLQTEEGLHWWQWVRLEVLESGPVCRTIRAQGAIPVHIDKPEDEPAEGMPFTHPSAHRHNHVRGEVFIRCYANGVIDLRVRHVNGTFFSEGGDVCGAVPVIGFRAPGLAGETSPREVIGPERWEAPAVAIDTTPGATLLGRDAPGKVWSADGCLIYQPYAGVEPKAGKPAHLVHGDNYLSRAEQRRIPRGVARTVRLWASLGEAPPEVATYLMPDWWYGASGELFLEPLVPVRDRFSQSFEAAVSFFLHRAHTHCFDDGAVGRSVRLPEEPGWEGETSFGQILAAYHTGDPAVYDLAIRSCYHLADVGTDHVRQAVRMHGYAPPALSLSMQRVAGMISGYLETGDSWFIETAEAVADHAWHWDTAAWPRRSIGRDASYIRSLLALYRCTGHELYKKRGREALRRVVATQLPDGSYRQQGGTVGLHAAVNLTVKPWMGCAATEAIIDYLFLEDDEAMERAVMRFADWLLGHKVSFDGETYWPYRYSGGDGNRNTDTNLPSRRPWHVEYLALIMGWAAVRTGKPDYYRAWSESWEAYGVSRISLDHAATKAVQHVTWLRSRLWGARLDQDGVTTEPRHQIAPDLQDATIRGPATGVKTPDRDPATAGGQPVSGA